MSHLKEPHLPLTKMFLARSSFSQSARSASVSVPAGIYIRQGPPGQYAYHLVIVSKFNTRISCCSQIKQLHQLSDGRWQKTCRVPCRDKFGLCKQGTLADD